MIHHRSQALDPDLTSDRLLIGSVLIEGGLMLSVTLPIGRSEDVGDLSFSPNAFIRIDNVGQVFLTLPRMERDEDDHALLLVAEELEVGPNQVHLEQAVPSERPSSKATLDVRADSNLNAVRNAWKPLREVSATARAMLIAAAAKRWDVDARVCQAYDGEVIHTATWRKLSYGQLAAEAAREAIPRGVELKRRAATALRQA